jgi:glycosyltransferase involved in cell wall biosynthesis
MKAETVTNDHILMTILTPTYNRADRIHRPFESLLKQEGGVSFEWLIVDDGSTDNTEQRIEEFKRKSPFPIRYYRKANGGKHTAVNMGVGLARGEYCTVLDSDDELTPPALADMKRCWEMIPAEERGDYGYLMGLVLDNQGRLQGQELPQEFFDASILDCRYKYKIHGERIETTRTNVLREFPYPEPPYRMPSFSPGVIWSRIGRKYKTRFVNHVWRIWYTDDGDRIGTMADPKQWFGYLSLVTTLNEHLDYLKYDPMAFLRHAIGVVRYGFALGETRRQINDRLMSWKQRLLVLVAIPAYYHIEQKKKRQIDG